MLFMRVQAEVTCAAARVPNAVMVELIWFVCAMTVEVIVLKLLLTVDNIEFV
jgi:hypothetical protein